MTKRIVTMAVMLVVLALSAVVAHAERTTIPGGPGVTSQKPHWNE